MTRRGFFRMVMAAGVSPALGEAPLVVPVRQVLDRRAKNTPEQLDRYWSSIWPEAIADFGRCGIDLRSSTGSGEIRRSPSDKPIFTGLERGLVNLVLTDHVPMAWDHGRGLSGITTIWDGYQVCVIALDYAHGHQIPFVSVNTCEHELLHAFLGDIFEVRPTALRSETRELRIDAYATRLWLFHNGSGLREAVKAYLALLPVQKAGQRVFENRCLRIGVAGVAPETLGEA